MKFALQFAVRMAFAALIFSLVVAHSLIARADSSSSHLIQRLDHISTLMNKRVLSRQELQLIEKSFHYGEDRVFFDQIKANKAFFNANLRVERAYASLFLVSGQVVLAELDFLDQGLFMVNGKKFELQTGCSIWSQLRPLLSQSHKHQLEAGFSLALLPRAWADNALATSDEQNAATRFLVSSILQSPDSAAIAQKKFSASIDFSASDQEKLTVFNGESVQGAGQLHCNPSAPARGTLSIVVDGNANPMQVDFETVQTAKGLSATLRFSKDPIQEVHYDWSEGSEKYKSLACYFSKNFKNGRFNIAASSQSRKLPSDRSFASTDVDDLSKAIGDGLSAHSLNPIISQCKAANYFKGGLLAQDDLNRCLSDACSGQVPLFNEVVNRTPRDFVDFSSASDKMHLATEDLQGAQKILVASLRGVSQIGWSPQKKKCATSVFPEDCVIDFTDDVPDSYATYDRARHDIQDSERAYLAAMDRAAIVARAALVTCSSGQSMAIFGQGQQAPQNSTIHQSH